MHIKHHILNGIILTGIGAAFVCAAQTSVQGIMNDLENAPEISAKPVAEPKMKVKGSTRSGEDPRQKVEAAAMDSIDLDWGLILRSYSVNERFVQNLLLEDAVKATNVGDKLSVIDFPEGASAVYMPDSRKLFVKNTSANLTKLEKMLDALDTQHDGDSGQVKIEARFVEFSEGSLEELGFEWSTADGIDLGSDVEIPAGENLFAGSLRSMPYTQTSTLGAGELSAAGPWSTSRLEDTFGSEAAGMMFSFNSSDSFDLLLRAMDQTSGIDVISSPSIVTLSGEKAMIKVGEKHNYPQIYEEGASSGTILHVQYRDFVSKVLGVEMAVTPVIKGNEIELKINPKITELVGWQQYELASADTSYTYYQFRIGMQYEHPPIRARLPVFKRREIETEVSLVSGSTIGMGGLITEKIESFEDRVPVLGSMPLLGRFFRSEGERKIKRNLMLFVTATKVEPNGRLQEGRVIE